MTSKAGSKLFLIIIILTITALAYSEKFIYTAETETTGQTTTASPDVVWLKKYQSKKINWKAVLLSGDNDSNVFDNARKTVSRLFNQYGVLQKNMIHLSSMRSEVNNEVKYASIASLKRAFHDLKVQKGDGCVLFITSHGTKKGRLTIGKGYMNQNQLNAILDKDCGDKPTIILVSSCFSGVFAGYPMEKPNRVILTAARHDKPSFGCGHERKYNYWDGCLIEKLPVSDTWDELAMEVKQCITAKEKKKGFKRSYPQSLIGEFMFNLRIFKK